MKRFLAANWKMFKTLSQARNTAKEIVENLRTKIPEDQEIIICPPFTALQSVAEVIQDISQFKLGGQNFYPADQGAFTGEISVDMLLDSGCTYAIVGHSERRHVLHESLPFIAEKVQFGLNKDLKIILCIGETLEERENGQLVEILNNQLTTALHNMTMAELKDQLFIAYEPVWAIGTGKVAQQEDIVEAHSIARNILKEFLGQESKSIPILYGGSVKPDNSSEILSLDNVNGVLVGGASLDSEKFNQIILNGL